MEPIKTITYSTEFTDKIKMRLQGEYAGKWVITQSFHIQVTAKPNWLHRKMARLLLGWEWEDKE